jgi:tripartite-type tricarboxylate transporter receptor subunit TctC
MTMFPGGRQLVGVVVGAVAATAWAQTATYPSKPVRVVVALAAGGGVDTSARVVGQKLAEAWGQQVLIENRPGAGGTIAAEAVSRAAPDGYTLLMHSIGHTIAAGLYRLPYDAVRDFAPITLVVQAPNVLAVHPSLPVRSTKELIALAKTRPDDLPFSSSGNGSPTHLTLSLFQSMAGIRLVHVPYKGTGPGITDLIGGRVSLTSASVVSIMPHAAAGRLRALAMVGSRRCVAAPELPTVAESGLPGFAVDTWYGLFAPAGTPRDIVARIQEDVAKVVAQVETRDRMVAQGLEPVANPPDQFAAYVRAETARWSKVIREAGIKAD